MFGALGPLSLEGAARESGFNREVIPHLAALHSFALRLTNDPEDARDLVQETSLRAWRFFHRFRAGTNCRAWLLAILHNNARNLWRRNQAERLRYKGNLEGILDGVAGRVHDRELTPESETVGRGLGNAMVKALVKALATLPEEFRTALILIDVHDQTYHQAAKVLSVPIGTVKSRVSRGRALMRRKLKFHARDEHRAMIAAPLRLPNSDPA
jgi:RNA polymerase sigma factor (sigma-70 family)